MQEFDFTQSNDPTLYATALAEILHAIDPDISKPVISTAPTSSIPAPPERPLSTTERLAREAHTAYGREHWSYVVDKTEILVERDAMTATLWRERASAAFALGDNKIGLAVVKQALKAGPDDADTLLLYVRLTARAGDDAQAADIYRNAYALVSLDDTTARLATLNEWIATLARLGRWDEFVRRVDDARRISSNDPCWRLRWVEALLADRKFDEAIAASSHIPHDTGMDPLLSVWQTAIATAIGAGNWSLRHNLLEASRVAGVDANTIARWRLDFPHFVLMGTISPYGSEAIGYSRYVQAIAWASDSARLATFSRGHPVKIWEAATGRLLLTLPDKKNEKTQALARSPNGVCLATVCYLHDPKGNSSGSKGKIWEMATGRLLATLEEDKDGEPIWTDAIAWGPDNTRLAASNQSYALLQIWNAVTRQHLITIKGIRAPLAWSPDGIRIAGDAASGGFESQIQIREISTGRLLGTPVGKGRNKGAEALAWAPDNVRLAIASYSHGAEIFEASSGHLLVSLTGHSAGVRAVAWSPDGTKLATASDDWTARVWEANSGGMLATLTGHGGPISDIAWAPNGMHLATASADGTVKIWRAE